MKHHLSSCLFSEGLRSGFGLSRPTGSQYSVDVMPIIQCYWFTLLILHWSEMPHIGVILELGRCWYFRSVSVSVFFLTINSRHVLKNCDPSFPSLLVPYHAQVSKQLATPVLLDCLCMDFCTEYIHVNLSFVDVIDYYTSPIFVNHHHGIFWSVLRIFWYL